MAHKWRRQHLKCKKTTFLDAAEVVGSRNRLAGTDEVGCGFLRIECPLQVHGLAADRQNQVNTLPIYRIQVDSATAHDSDHRLATPLGTACHAHRRLTGGGLLIHIALACNDQVDIAYTLVKPHEIEHRLHARAQLGTERQQRGT